MASIRVWIALVVALAVLLAGCGGGGGSGAQSWLTGIETDPPEAAAFTENGEDYYFTQTAAGLEFRIRPSATFAATFEVDGVQAPAGQWLTIRFDDLDAETSKTLIARNTIGAVVGTVELWARPDDFPIVRVDVFDPLPGWTHLGIFKFGGPSTLPNFLTILDETGQPLFIRRKTGTRMMNFNRVELGAATYYTYNEEPYGVILDEEFREVDRFTLVPHGGSTWTEVDLHELLMLDVGHYVVPAYAPRTVNNDPTRPGQTVNVTAAVIQEIQNGAVVFQWDSTEHPELYALSTAGNGDDYVHLNSIEIDPRDGHFITSNRHLDNVMKIHRTTGEIIWILSGLGDQFGLSPAQMLSKCHDARMSPDGVLTVFDNGNSVGLSRVVRMTLDEQAKTVLTYEQFTIDNHFSPAMGSAQFLNPNTVFVGWGARRPAESDVTEWDVGTGTKRMEIWLNGNDTPGIRTTSYRARKYPPLTTASSVRSKR